MIWYDIISYDICPPSRLMISGSVLWITVAVDFLSPSFPKNCLTPHLCQISMGWLLAIWLGMPLPWPSDQHCQGSQQYVFQKVRSFGSAFACLSIESPANLINISLMGAEFAMWMDLSIPRNVSKNLDVCDIRRYSHECIWYRMISYDINWDAESSISATKSSLYQCKSLWYHVISYHIARYHSPSACILHEGPCYWCEASTWWDLCGGAGSQPSIRSTG